MPGMGAMPRPSSTSRIEVVDNIRSSVPPWRWYDHPVLFVYQMTPAEAAERMAAFIVRQGASHVRACLNGGLPVIASVLGESHVEGVRAAGGGDAAILQAIREAAGAETFARDHAAQRVPSGCNSTTTSSVAPRSGERSQATGNTSTTTSSATPPLSRDRSSPTHGPCTASGSGASSLSGDQPPPTDGDSTDGARGSTTPPLSGDRSASTAGTSTSGAASPSPGQWWTPASWFAALLPPIIGLGIAAVTTLQAEACAVAPLLFFILAVASWVDDNQRFLRGPPWCAVTAVVGLVASQPTSGFSLGLIAVTLVQLALHELVAHCALCNVGPNLSPFRRLNRFESRHEALRRVGSWNEVRTHSTCANRKQWSSKYKQWKLDRLHTTAKLSRLSEGCVCDYFFPGQSTTTTTPYPQPPSFAQRDWLALAIIHIFLWASALVAVTNGVDSLWVTLILCPVQCISRDLLNMPKIRLAAMLFATIAILEVVRTDQPGCDLVLPADGSVFFVLVFSFVTIDTVTRAAQTSSAFHPLCIVERLLERWQSLACFLKFHRSQVRVVLRYVSLLAAAIAHDDGASGVALLLVIQAIVAATTWHSSSSLKCSAVSAYMVATVCIAVGTSPTSWAVLVSAMLASDAQLFGQPGHGPAPMDGGPAPASIPVGMSERSAGKRPAAEQSVRSSAQRSRPVGMFTASASGAATTSALGRAPAADSADSPRMGDGISDRAMLVPPLPPLASRMDADVLPVGVVSAPGRFRLKVGDAVKVWWCVAQDSPGEYYGKVREVGETTVRLEFDRSSVTPPLNHHDAIPLDWITWTQYDPVVTCSAPSSGEVGPQLTDSSQMWKDGSGTAIEVGHVLDGDLAKGNDDRTSAHYTTQKSYLAALPLIAESEKDGFRATIQQSDTIETAKHARFHLACSMSTRNTTRRVSSVSGVVPSDHFLAQSVVRRAAACKQGGRTWKQIRRGRSSGSTARVLANKASKILRALGAAPTTGPLRLRTIVRSLPGPVNPAVLKIRDAVKRHLDPLSTSFESADMINGSKFEDVVRDELLERVGVTDVVTSGFELLPSDHRKGFSPDGWITQDCGALVLLEVKWTRSVEIFDALDSAADPLDALKNHELLQSKGWLEQIMICLGRRRTAAERQTDMPSPEKALLIVGLGDVTTVADARGDTTRWIEVEVPFDRKIYRNLEHQIDVTLAFSEEMDTRVPRPPPRRGGDHVRAKRRGPVSEQNSDQGEGPRRTEKLRNEECNAHVTACFDLPSAPNKWTVTSVDHTHTHPPNTTEQTRYTNEQVASAQEEVDADGNTFANIARRISRETSRPIDIERLRDRAAAYARDTPRGDQIATLFNIPIADYEGYFIARLRPPGLTSDVDDVCIVLLPGADQNGDRHIPRRVPKDEMDRYIENDGTAMCLIDHPDNTAAPPTWAPPLHGKSLVEGLVFVTACIGRRSSLEQAAASLHAFAIDGLHGVTQNNGVCLLSVIGHTNEGKTSVVAYVLNAAVTSSLKKRKKGKGSKKRKANGENLEGVRFTLLTVLPLLYGRRLYGVASIIADGAFVLQRVAEEFATGPCSNVEEPYKTSVLLCFWHAVNLVLQTGFGKRPSKKEGKRTSRTSDKKNKQMVELVATVCTWAAEISRSCLEADFRAGRKELEAFIIGHADLPGKKHIKLSILNSLTSELRKAWWKNQSVLFRAHKKRDRRALCGLTLAASWGESDNSAVRRSLGRRAGLANVSAGLMRKQVTSTDRSERRQRRRTATAPKDDMLGVGASVTRNAVDLVLDGLLPPRPGYKWSTTYQRLPGHRVQVNTHLIPTRAGRASPQAKVPWRDPEKYPVSATLGVNAEVILSMTTAADGTAYLRCNGRLCNCVGVPCVHLVQFLGTPLCVDDFHPKFLRTASWDDDCARRPTCYMGAAVHDSRLTYTGQLVAEYLAEAEDQVGHIVTVEPLVQEDLPESVEAPCAVDNRECQDANETDYATIAQDAIESAQDVVDEIAELGEAEESQGGDDRVFRHKMAEARRAARQVVPMIKQASACAAAARTALDEGLARLRTLQANRDRGLGMRRAKRGQGVMEGASIDASSVTSQVMQSHDKPCRVSKKKKLRRERPE